MFRIVTQFMLIIALISSVAIPLFIIVQSYINFSRVKENHFFILLKAIGFLFIWLLLTFGMFNILFVIFYSAAHIANPEGADIAVAKWLTFLSIIYILLGVGLVFFIRRVPKGKVESSSSNAT